jgi:ABC-type glycerol-3-phosphate transport system permease component
LPIACQSESIGSISSSERKPLYQLTNPPSGQPQYGPPAAIALVSIVVAIFLTLAYQRAIRRGASSK